MLYVKSRKNFEMRREKRFITLPCENTRKFITLPCAKKNTQQRMAMCAHDKKVDVCPIESTQQRAGFR
jgi:hypothetical protein